VHVNGNACAEMSLILKAAITCLRAKLMDESMTISYERFLRAIDFAQHFFQVSSQDDDAKARERKVICQGYLRLSDKRSGFGVFLHRS
jgi:hypothetical protein